MVIWNSINGCLVVYLNGELVNLFVVESKSDVLKYVKFRGNFLW